MEIRLQRWLEVLDPEQNIPFNDNYLELEYDLPRSFSLHGPIALETIPPRYRSHGDYPYSGYTQEEKPSDSPQVLVPEQIQENGLTGSSSALQTLPLKRYLMSIPESSGVRNLNRELGSGCAWSGQSDCGRRNHYGFRRSEGYNTLSGVNRNFSSDIAGVRRFRVWLPVWQWTSLRR